MLLIYSSAASELQAYVMQFNRMTQKQAKAWLDKWTPGWEMPKPEKTMNTIYYDEEKTEQ